MKPRSHIPALDGLRGCAILVVLVCHFGAMESPGAYSEVIYAGRWGVDLFFALSGFLITGILLETLESPSYFRTFYARRTLRIFPLYYAFIGLSVLSIAISHQFGYARHTTADSQVWYWLYLSNWHDVFHPEQGALPGTNQFWSLAIEEQFYLAWPLIVILSRRRLISVCLGIAALSCMARFWMGGVDLMTRLTPLRLDALALGATAAVILSRPKLLARIQSNLPAVACASLLLTAVLAAKYGVESQAVDTAGILALAIGFAALVLYCAITDSVFTRALCCRPLREMGKYSYGIYVLHYAFMPHRQGSVLRSLMWINIGIFVSYAAARVSWAVIERPFLKLKTAVRYQEPQIVKVPTMAQGVN